MKYSTWLMAVALMSAALAWATPLRAGDPALLFADGDFEGNVYEAGEIDQAAAEQLFASADAAIYFPDLQRARWLEAGGISASLGRPAVAESAVTKSLRDFEDDLEADFPRFRSNGYGPYLLKLPAIGRGELTALPAENMTVSPSATLFTDSFETGLSQWQLADDTNGNYTFSTMGCKTHSGSWSADAVRGGFMGQYLFCSENYPASATTQITHSACEGVQGAAQAWLDFYLTAEMDSTESIGVYYLASDGYLWGYAFSGNWSGWYHIVLNMKQWFHSGDLTTQSCPRVVFQFKANASNTAGAGPQIDDVTIRTDAPPFLRCSITATPASGSAPLAVNFVSNVTGATGNETYEWRFGDAAATTSANRNASFTYSNPGDYYVRLRVVDTNGVRGYAGVMIQVGTVSACTLACTASGPASVTAGSLASFQATATPSGCSASPTYAWTFGDGQSSTQQNPSHIYGDPGTYSWSMTATAGGTKCAKTGAIIVAGSNPSQSKRRSVARPPSDGTLATQTIGTSGGTLSGNGFTLTVPAGAFTGNASLILSKTASPRPDRGEVSDRFRLRGLPDSLAKDLTVEIQLPSSASPLASGEKYYISIDAPVYIDHNETMAPFRLLATVSGQKLSIAIPKNWPAFSTTATTSLEITPHFEFSPNVEIQANMFATVQSEHFTAFVPLEMSSETREILNMLESHFQKLEGFGFSFACRVSSGTFRKIEVVPYAFGQGGDLGAHVSRSSPCGAGWMFNDFLEITTSYPPTDPSVNYAAGHELFHLLQDIYSPGGAQANLWLKEASSIWYELALGNPCPTVQTPYQMFPWNGLLNSKNSVVPGDKPTDIEAHHGYGASYFLWHHSGSNGLFVSLVWQFIREGQSELAALQSAMGSTSLSEYWAGFARDYFDGKISGGCPVSWASFARDTITDQSSLPKSVKIPASPLSAKSWNLDLRSFSASTTQPVTLTAAGLIDNQSAYVYDVKAKADLAELTKQNPKYAIGDLNTMKGTILVIVVVDRNLPASDPNAQSATNEITLNIGAEGSSAALRYFFQVVEKSCTGDTSLIYVETPKYELVATWTGNTFRSNWSEGGTDPYEGTVWAHEVAVTGTADRSTLVSLQFSEYRIATTPAGKHTPSMSCDNGCRDEEWRSITLANVPGTEYVFVATGATARGMITSWYHHWVKSGHTADYYNFDCTYPIDESRLGEVYLNVRVSPAP